MKTIFRVMALLIAVGMISTVEAKTTKYELINLSSQNGDGGNALYPGLQFYQATSATLTVTTIAPDFEPKISLLEVTFPNAAKFKATNFKLIEGTKYRAYVADAWVYRELIVDLDFNAAGPVMIQTYISDRVGFIKPATNAQSFPPITLFSVFGSLNDITPTRVVDQKVLTVAGKKLILSLRDRLLLNGQFIPEGFAVDALWYGKGTKTLVLPAPFGRDMFDKVEVVALVIDGNINDPVVSVKFKDPNGNEIPSSPIRLRDLLDQAYGPTPW
jgi:hypothetical protein